MDVVIGTHGHCFDGLASATVFAAMLRELAPGKHRLRVRTFGYAVDDPKPDDSAFDGAVNALLDYRFHPSPHLTWYFDHHRTAFGSAADRAVFESRRGTGRYHFDAGCSSCTLLITRVARDHFGVELPTLEPLVAWADRIDAARFDGPEATVHRTDPVLQLAAVVEQHGNDELLQELLGVLLDTPPAEAAALPWVQRLHAPIAAAQARFIEAVERHAEREGPVVAADLTHERLEASGKFVTYALYPDSTYSVLLTRGGGGLKLSLGYNPWSGKPRRHDISDFCARHGGGGHPVVGAVSFPESDATRARDVFEQAKRLLAG